jgi:hypothetical protein
MRMTIRRRLFLLLVGLCVTAALTVFIFGFMEGQESYLKTYGWSDPVTIHGPEERATPPQIAATTSRGTTIAVWDQLHGKGPLMVARSTRNDTWEVRPLTSNDGGVQYVGFTDVNTEPSIQEAGDGSVYVAWRGETSTDVSGDTGIYTSGVFWTRSTDQGEVWQKAQSLAVFQANYSEGYEETVYSKPQVCAFQGGVRIYYTSNQDPEEGWVWYRDSFDQGNTWSSPNPVPGSSLYDILLLTSQGDLLSLSQREDGAIALTVNRGETQGSEDSREAAGEAKGSLVGHGWPSGLFEDSNHTLWAIWDRETTEEQNYILENGTVMKSRYVGNQVWISRSTDQGGEWTEPALLATGGSMRMGVMTQTPNGYTAIYAQASRGERPGSGQYRPDRPRPLQSKP